MKGKEMLRYTLHKRILPSVLAFGLIATTAGCGKKQTSSVEGDGEIPQTLTVFAPLAGSAVKGGAEDNNDILSFQLMEKETGCHVEWIQPASEGLDEQFNLMIVSGELPDVIVYGWRNLPGGSAKYADDGFIIPLQDYIEEYMPNLDKLNKERPDIKKQYVDDEGKIYYIPFVRGDEKLQVFQGPQVRQDWLDKLGLEQPTTTDELYNVLKAMKTQDPNGNGKADEVPMSGIGFDNESYGIGNLLWAFGTHYDFYVDGGEVKYGIMDDSFKEGVSYLRKLYSEGLIDVDYMINDRGKMDAKVMNDRVGFLYSFQPNNFYSSMTGTSKVISGIGHIKGADGVARCYNSAYATSVTPMEAAITTANKNPKGTLKWLDAFYGEKGMMYMNFGEEGKTYEMVDGYPKLTDYLLNNPDGKDKDSMLGLSIGIKESSFPALQDWRYYEQTLSPWSKDAINTWSKADSSGVLPQVSLTTEENEKVTQIMSQVESYVLENVNKLILGQTDMSKYDDIKEKVRSMGIEDALKIYNAAYKRYQKR